ncbi:MAG: hydroxyacylglutathione hydrolase [Myxococcota bacterium]
MLELVQIPVWRDNYAYLLCNGTRAFVVDPPEAAPVLAVLRQRGGLTLEAVINTHHHPDHVGGNAALADATGCEIVGPAHDAERIPGLSRPTAIGDSIEVAGVTLRVLDVHAHTRGHIAFVCDAPIDRVMRHGHDGVSTVIERLNGRPALFVGDSLFLGGCGRLFEGTPADLHASMTVLAAESPEALVCCAHEYTGSNLRFAAHVLSSNATVQARLEGLDEERAGSSSSVPDTLAREFETNPFLMALDASHRDTMSAALGVSSRDTVGVLGALRSAKDRF